MTRPPGADSVSRLTRSCIGAEGLARAARSAIFAGLCLLGAVLPEPATASASEDRLDSALALRWLAALEKAQVPTGAVSLVVSQHGANEPVVSLNAAVPRNPASVMKIVTTFAALDQLGPGYRWKTEAFADAKPDDVGRVKTLYLRGNGNPFWVSDEFNAFVRAVYLRGVREVTGDLVLDRSYYDLPPGDPAAFDEEPHRVYNVLPTPLTVNFNALTLLLVPNVAAHRLDVHVDPPVTTLGVNVDVVLKRRACERQHLDLNINVLADDTGFMRAELTGQFPNRCRAYEITRALLSPTEQLIGAFEARWNELGGGWSGGHLEAEVPEGAVPIYEQPSRTLGEITRSMNKFSNNVMARQIFLTLGAEAGDAPATLVKSRAATDAALKRHGVDTTGLFVDNGAGLSRDARASAQTLMQLLAAARRHRYAPEFFAALPVPGVDGTLAVRFPEGPFVGQAHVKTGTLDHVIGLAGQVQGADGVRYDVVLLINHTGIHHGTGRSLQKILLRALTR